MSPAASSVHPVGGVNPAGFAPFPQIPSVALFVLSAAPNVTDGVDAAAPLSAFAVCRIALVPNRDMPATDATNTTDPSAASEVQVNVTVCETAVAAASDTKM